MKLPEKLKGTSMGNGIILLSETDNKINEIIDYLSELHEQQKPCKHELEPLSTNPAYNTCKKCRLLVAH